MGSAVPMVDVWRGDLVESQHLGHAVICDKHGQIVDAWGDPNQIIYPRSAAKPILALPLLESGAAAAHGLKTQHLALACASHIASTSHTDTVNAWMAELGLKDTDFRCGAQVPEDEAVARELILAGQSPCQVHNVCSGKHAGFLTVAKHLRAGPEYIEIDHPVQVACLAAFEDMTGETSSGYGVDGCSAPNFQTSLHGMARAMAAFANASENGDARQKAARQLWQSMVLHPENIAGEGKACTELMRACSEPVALKYGAEGFYIGILPNRGLGLALKVSDGALRGAECSVAALLVRLGVLDANHPAALKFMTPTILSKAGLLAGRIAPSPGLL